jgi:hypothetical protein
MSPPADDGSSCFCQRLASRLDEIDKKLEIIMTDDASVLAVVTDEDNQIAALGTAVGALQALVVALQAENLQPSTLAALQAAQASLDTLAATGAADVTTDTPVVTPPAA